MRASADYLMTEEPSFRDVAEALGLGVTYRVEVAPDGRSRFLHMGPGCLPLTGLPPEAFISDIRALTDIMTPDELARLDAEQRAALAENRACTGEFRLRRPSGETRWIRLNAIPRARPDGLAVWDGLMTDVTEAKRLAEQLADERRRLELAIEVSEIGVYEWRREDPDTLLWSDRQYEIFGLEPRTPVTVDGFWAMVHPEDREGAAARPPASPFEDGAEYATEHRIVRPDGEIRWVQLRGRSAWDEDGMRGMYGTALDVTDRREAEERRRLQVLELAHRGKNALSVMVAMLQQAARKARSVDDLTEVLMARLTAMAKSQDLVTAWEGERLPLIELLTQVLAPFDLTHVDIDPSLDQATISGDVSIGLALLLHELATNAVKYGALSNATGRVVLAREPANDGAVLIWRETGGPPVRPVERQGFGSRLISTVLRGVGGGAEAFFEPAGVVVRIRLPA